MSDFSLIGYTSYDVISFQDDVTSLVANQLISRCKKGRQDRDARPLLGPIFFIITQYLGIISQNISLAPPSSVLEPLWYWRPSGVSAPLVLAPPSLGNPPLQSICFSAVCAQTIEERNNLPLKGSLPTSPKVPQTCINLKKYWMFQHFTLTSGGSRIFQRRGAYHKYEGANLLFWPLFPKNCMKMKKKLGPTRGLPGSPSPSIHQCLHPPLVTPKRSLPSCL